MVAKCPVCDQEFPDVDAVRRHTRDDHGLSPGRDRAGSWAPVAGPGPEGWYADPWNAKFQRWWDGKQWSGRTAAAGTHQVGPAAEAQASAQASGSPAVAPKLTVVPDPPRTSGADLLEQARSTHPRSEPPPASTPAPVWNDPDEDFDLPRPRTKRISPTAAVAASLIGALVVVGGLVYLSIGGSGGAKEPNVLPAVNTNPGQSRLATGVASLPDLGLGWTPYPAAHALTPAIYKVGPCGSGLWEGDLGGYEDSFINGDKAVAAHGAVVSQVREAADAASADRQRQFVTSPDFIPCLKQTVSQEVSSQFPPGSRQRVGDITVHPLDIHLPVTSQAFVLTAAVLQSNGLPGPTITDESVQLFTGPYTATIDVSWCSCAPLTQQVVEKVATAVALRIAALPPQGTLSP